MAEVFRAARDLIVQNGRLARRGIDAHVRHDEIRTRAPGQHSHARHAADKILGLRQRECRVGGGNAFLHHAVVRRRDDDGAARNPVINAAGHTGEQRGDILQTPQASGRFAQGVQPRPRGKIGLLVPRTNGGEQFL